MQKQITKRLALNTRRKLLKVGVSRQGIVRERAAKKPNPAPVFRNGLFTLKLKPIPAYEVLSIFDIADKKAGALLEDLYPAYQQFLRLHHTPEKNILASELPINMMFDHIEQIIGCDNELGIFYCDTDKKNYFNYLTTIRGGNEYCVFTYAPVIKSLQEQKDRVYTKLLHKAFMSMRKMGIARWDDLADFVLDWLGDEEEWEERQLEYEEILTNRKLRRKYMTGEAAKGIERLHRYPELTQADIDRLNLQLDPDHPVSKFVIDVFALSQTKKKIWDYCHEPDEYIEHYILFPDTFCLYYELDHFFLMHEEYINDQAREGVQEPRISTKITEDMTVLPDTEDSFPTDIVSLFYTHGDMDKQITKYYKHD